MRNSFHTAGFSEVVHEIKQDPAEASYVYTAVARHSPRRGVSVRIGPAVLGSVKSARKLGTDVGSPADGDAPSPMDLALTGIASCAVATLLGGGSAQEMTFDGVQMSMELDSTGAVRCRIDAEGVADQERLTGLVDRMRSFSPNFTTMTRAVPVSTDFAAGAVRRHVAVAGPGAGFRPAACRVRWLSGTQLESFPACAPPLRVDQPKQLTGVDWGPNPQEYLLMALAADVAQQMGRTAGDEHVWEVRTRAREDVRGLLLKTLDVVVLQDVECVVVVPDSQPGSAAIEKMVSTAFAQSQVRDLISRPHPAEITLASGRAGAAAAAMG